MKLYRLLLLSIIIFLLQGCVYHIFKPLPVGTDYESEYYNLNENEVDFLYDLTYKYGEERVSEQEIFDTILAYVDSAQSYILIDMFLFNSYIGKEGQVYRKISEQLASKLIGKKQIENFQIDFITDPVNTVYGGADCNEIDRMKDAGINVIFTDLKKLPDSNVIFSPIWRLFFQWFGNSNKYGILPHPFSDSEQNVTLRSYLTLLNFKANHRKVFVADYNDSWVSVITSANPQDGSSAHSNIGVLIHGDFAGEIFYSEGYVAKFSDSSLSSEIVTERNLKENDIKLKLITEEKIKDNLIMEIDISTAKDSIKFGMFYLSDRDIINSLLKAAKRGVDIKIILDPNKDAFGRKKNGIPNRPVAHELTQKSEKKIQIKWFSTHGEQFHTKIIFFDRLIGDDIAILGSANYTKRNIDNKNLEMNVMIRAKSDTDFFMEIDDYFHLIWNEPKFTLDYEVYESKSLWKKFIYRFTEFSGSSTY